MAFADIHYETTPPERTDGNETADLSSRLRLQRPTEPWQRILHRDMVILLAQAQGTSSDLVICAGCGRELELPFMELDHIAPKSDRGENYILNRILLCRPCNGRKSDNLTLRGLVRENRKSGWLKDEGLAKRARELAADKAEWVRDCFGTTEYWNSLKALPPGYESCLF